MASGLSSTFFMVMGAKTDRIEVENGQGIISNAIGQKGGEIQP